MMIRLTYQTLFVVYLMGFLVLPFMWLVNVIYFFPELRRRPNDLSPLISTCASLSPSSIIIFVHDSSDYFILVESRPEELLHRLLPVVCHLIDLVLSLCHTLVHMGTWR